MGGVHGIAVAAYAYAAQADDELSLEEGESVYLEELVDDAWWRARRRHVDAAGHVVPGADEERGLIPANYVESAPPLRTVRAAYAYAAQNDDELTFDEGDTLDVYEVDGDWLLAAHGGQYGLIPANYVEEGDAGDAGDADAGDADAHEAHEAAHEAVPEVAAAPVVPAAPPAAAPSSPFPFFFSFF